MKNILTFLSLVLVSFTAQATHNRAGEIIYKRIAPFFSGVGSATVQVYTYSITVIRYTDHGSSVADRCLDTVYFGDGQKGVASRMNGVSSATCNCGTNTCGEIILNTLGYVIKKNMYSVVHTYAGPGTYLIRSSDPNRNGGIRNIPNSVNTPFTLESIIIINSATGANSSPVLSGIPFGEATLNVCFSHNLGATDADGDSLSYEITPCLAAGYFYPEVANPGGTYGINATTGLLTWCNPIFLDEYNVAMLIKEWRKNLSGIYQLNGQIMREMQILVKYGVVGLSENTNQTKIEFYPNPAASQLNIKFDTKSISLFECEIIDISGKIVLRQTATNVSKELILDLSGLSQGIYLIQAKADGQVTKSKIVKE